MEVVVILPRKSEKSVKMVVVLPANITNSLADITNSLTNSITYIPVNPSTSSNIPSHIPSNSSNTLVIFLAILVPVVSLVSLVSGPTQRHCPPGN